MSAFAALQRRLVDVYREALPALVRVKASVEETDSEGRSRRIQRIGTGFFISREGLVLASATVAADAARVWLEQDGLSYPCEVLGTDAETNFALLRALSLPPRVSALVLPTDTSPPEIGTLVVAVTAPLDLDPTPTLGLIAGRDGGFSGRTFPLPYLRISVPANPGESGSPVLDLSGRVVGMMIASVPDLGSSYALPTSAMVRLRDDIVFNGGPRPGWIGWDVVERSDRNTASGRRLEVTAVQDGSPAAAAGVLVGDSLVRLGDAPVRSLVDLRVVTFFARSGEVLRATVRRDGREFDVALTVADRPGRVVREEADPPAPEPAPVPSPDPVPRERGVRVPDTLPRGSD
jgi:serine protease Do